MTFRSFTIVAILLMLMVYVIRLVVKYALSYWPLLRGKVLLWIKRDKVDNGGDMLPWIKFENISDTDMDLFLWNHEACEDTSRRSRSRSNMVAMGRRNHGLIYPLLGSCIERESLKPRCWFKCMEFLNLSYLNRVRHNIILKKLYQLLFYNRRWPVHITVRTSH